MLSDSTVEKYATHDNVDGILAEMDVPSENDRIGFNEDPLSVIWGKHAWGPKLRWHEPDVMNRVSHDQPVPTFITTYLFIFVLDEAHHSTGTSKHPMDLQR